MDVRIITADQMIEEDKQQQQEVSFPPGYNYNNLLKAGFVDTGGTVDNAALTMLRVDVPNKMMYITGAMFWRVSEKEKILFASIRRDIAVLHLTNKFDMLGCETNNYGRTEMESLRLQYKIRMFGVNTTGRITDKKKLASGESMDKNAMVKFVNSWRQNAIQDPENKLKLGQIRFLKKKTKELVKLKNEFESFVRKMPEGIGATGQPKYGAEGSGHDDGVMSALGGIHMVKTKVFKIYTGVGSVGAVPNVPSSQREQIKTPMQGGRSIGRVDDSRYDL